VIEYTLQVLPALSYAHGRGVVHRDIKPANIMVTAHGVVKVMDFGIAKSRVENQLTQPGMTMGSVYYMSPEQVRGDAVDARSDLYSVGILLYELLSGRRPFEGDSTFGVLNQQLNSAPRPPMEINPALSKELNDVILRALAKDPGQRFESADTFRNALRTVGKAPSADVATLSGGLASAAVPGKPQGNAVQTGAPVGSATAPWTPVAAAGIVARAPASDLGGRQRAIWMSLGAFAVLAILAAAAIGLPHFFRTGAQSSNNNAPAQIATPEADRGTSATQVPAASAATGPASDSASSVPTTVPTQTQSISNSRPSGAVQHKTASGAQNVSGKPSASGDTAQASSDSAQPATVAGPSQEEIEQARDRKVQLDSRAAAVSASLENLRRQQEASGYGLRQDIAGAATRMGTYLQAADVDLRNGDVAAAQHDMDRADKEISTLEAFFHK
jgi:eukaryotic-like serine/threonine-protein kinase